MTDEHWDRIDRVWHEVLARPEHERRAAIADLCGSDELLRRDVESMLSNLSRANEAGFGVEASSYSLRPGTHLGRFEIQALLGAGGMGEVYRAHDSRLHRDVAIKVLPPDVAKDPDRLRRFEQEARATAALNHPNILAVHDVGSEQIQATLGVASTDVSFIVTELLEGRTLRQVLTDEELSTSRAIDLAAQIVDGLAAAHGRGVVHRDLKPENLFVTSDGHVKILDFGLAKALGVSAVEVATALTQTSTAAHVVIGTPAYMAPEQIRGQQVDHRSDIFAFGAVLYEMLTNVRAFSGETAQDTMSAVLRESPTASLWETKSGLSPSLIRIVERCLQKSPADRFQSTNDLAFALNVLTPGELTTAPQDKLVRRSIPVASLLLRSLPWALLAAMVVVVVGLWHPWRAPSTASNEQATETARPPISPIAVGLPPANAGEVSNSVQPKPPMVISTITAPSGAVINGTTQSYTPAISPDGSRVVYVARKPGEPWRLWLYTFASSNARPLEKTESVPTKDSPYRPPELPFWSPKSDEVAFASSGKLKRVNIDTGVVATICDLPGNGFQGGTWGPDGTIVFSSPPRGLQKVRAESGAPVPVTKVDEQVDERDLHPWFLPDGRHFVFQRVPGRRLMMGSLDDSKITPLGSTDSHVQYASGYLLYVQAEHLMAHAFDLKTLNVVGKPIPIAENVATHMASGRSTFTVSQNGMLIYRAGPEDEEEGSYQLAWFRRSDGGVDPFEKLEADTYMTLTLLADDQRVLSEVLGPDGTGNLWRLDLQSQTRQQVTGGRINRDHSARVSRENADEFMWLRQDSNAVYRMPWNGERPEEAFHKPDKNIITALTDWSKNFLIETMLDSKGQTDIWYVPVNDTRNPQRYEQHSRVERLARLSPDERWIAFASEDPVEGSRVQIRSFPSNAGYWPIENSKQVMDLQWRDDSKEVFFSQPGRGITAVEIKPSERAIELGKPQTFSIPGANLHRGFAVSRDGQRFLFSRNPRPDTGPVTYKVINNWQGLLPVQ